MKDRTYRRYLLVMLLLILAFNSVDRVALGVVLQNIKTDLNLTDTQLGFLSGIAFTLFYATMGIPIARWADRGNRVTIITVTTALWSTTVAMCGAAVTFVQLLLIRIGVAVGEAGCVPPAHSLIADYFSREERPRAVARYMLGVPVALTTGFFAAGWLNELCGWRATFVILGLPGLALAMVARLTLKEPRQTGASVAAVTHLQPSATASFSEPTLKTVCTTLWKRAAFRNLLVCHSVWYFFGYGILQWQPTFFVRSHHLSTGEIGTWFALIYGLGGGLGTYLGGEWAARYAAGNERLQLKACAFALGVYALLYVGAFLAPNYHLAVAALAVGNLGGSMVFGPILATIQTLVPARMRARSIALVYLFANLIGMGLGPLAAGVLSDVLRPLSGEESLRYALVLLAPGYFWAAWHLWLASQTVARDLATAQDNVGNDTRGMQGAKSPHSPAPEELC